MPTTRENTPRAGWFDTSPTVEVYAACAYYGASFLVYCLPTTLGLSATHVAPESKPVFGVLVGTSVALMLGFDLSLHSRVWIVLERTATRFGVGHALVRLRDVFGEYRSHRTRMLGSLGLALLENGI